MNPLIELLSFGQSFWYDNIRRKYLHDGTLENMISDDGLRGMTSNPSIFEKAIGHSDDYDDQIAELVAAGLDVQQIYEELALSDIRAACDMFLPLYEESSANDGFVSLEVSPYLARNKDATLQEARRLFATVGRPNLMIKVPATAEGAQVVRQLISEGINVNVTLLFSRKQYEAIVNAYIAGISLLIENGGDPTYVSSVASFFVSRVDTAVDRQLANVASPLVPSLLGKTAIANAKVVYSRYKEIFEGETFEQLMVSGARVQRLLWASTSTKNPEYPDTMYVDELIGPGTINTIPPQTVDAFRDHGRLNNSLSLGLDLAQSVLRQLSELGIDLDQETEQLQRNGVRAFSDSFDTLLETLAFKSRNLA